MKNYDITIIGAGMTGLLTACALSKSSLKIAIVDKQLPTTQWQDVNYDARVSAITAASQTMFANLEVWEAMKKHRVSAFEKMHVWDAAGGNAINFANDDVNKKQLGYIIENRVIQAALFERLKNCSVDFICPAQLEKFDKQAEKINLQLSDQTSITTQLLIGADGAESIVRKLAGFEIENRDYGHHALVCTIKTSLPHQQTAWQCFLPDGILAFLPLADSNTCSIVWSTTPDQARYLKELPQEEFNAKLAEAFAMRLGKITESSARFVFPLQMRHAKKYVIENIALIGDAAHTIHPLAGQGVNLGFLDGAALADVVLTAQQQGRNIGSLHTLRRYERWRKGENLLMLSFVAGVQKLFARQSLPVKTLRGWGLQLTDSILPLKKFFIQRAMGLTGDLPELAK